MLFHNNLTKTTQEQVTKLYEVILQRIMGDEIKVRLVSFVIIKKYKKRI